MGGERRTVAVIPARYASSRFPGKPLVDILGTSLVLRVWERTVGALPATDVYVATDDERIAEHCREHGAQVVMTSSSCLTGTDRVFEASQQIDADRFVNVQGDEPLVDPDDIRRVIAAADDRPDAVVNAMCPIVAEDDFRSVNVPHVAAAPDGRLLYMSRAAIPTTKELAFAWGWRQVCIYAFPRDALAAFAATGVKTPLEALEDIEILRFLELGVPVHMVSLESVSIAVDVPSDVARVEAALRTGRT